MKVPDHDKLEFKRGKYNDKTDLYHCIVCDKLVPLTIYCLVHGRKCTKNLALGRGDSVHKKSYKFQKNHVHAVI
jgi:hypothetical protein